MQENAASDGYNAGYDAGYDLSVLHRAIRIRNEAPGFY